MTVADGRPYFLLVMVLVGMIAFGFQRGGDISTPYVQSLRLIVKNSVLWVMFLASMSASVFFSFDSHFNAIFPGRAATARRRDPHHQPDRPRRLRHRRRTQKRQIARPSALFEHRWLEGLRRAALQARIEASQGAQGEIEKFFVQQMEDRQPRHQPSSRSASPPRRAARLRPCQARRSR